jgi:DNA-binding FrmR family transcriptional regulator
MNPQKEKTVIGLKKAHSLVAKLIAMVEKDEYCIDIMQQNLAAIGLLKSVHQQLMEGHLQSCFKNAMETSSAAKKQQMVTEILAVSKLANK